VKEDLILKQYASASKRTRCLRAKTVKCEAFWSLRANMRCRAIRKDSRARSTVDRSGGLTDKATGEIQGTMTNSALSDQEPTFIDVGDGNGLRRIAVRARPGSSPGSTSGAPGLIWLGGFKSDMRGTKALALDQWAAENGRACVRFDYSGHGESGGAFIDGTIGRWLEESVAVFEQFCQGPQVVIGSSMGGWMALLLARAIASRAAAPASLAGLVLIAPAPDFTEQLMWNGFSPEIREEILTKGVWMRPSEYGDGTPYPITRALIEEGRNHLLLGSAIEVGCPVRILQGAQDPDVPWQHAFALAHRLPAEDVVMTMIQDGDHRLSRPQDIARILAAVAEIG
jgi:pimeloyl-ACP methyl ester carboxylesterase